MNILYELARFSQILTKEPDNMSGLKCRNHATRHEPRKLNQLFLICQISRKESKEYANLYLGLPHYFYGWLNPGAVRFWLSSIINTTPGHFSRYKDRNSSNSPYRTVYESDPIVSFKILS